MCEKADKQHELDKRYLRMAAIWAENSYCKRRQVGALLVKDKMIISDGFNGTPAGFENVCEDETNRTKPYVLHAEANAITKVAASSNSSRDHPIRYSESGLFRRLSLGRWHRAVAAGGHHCGLYRLK